LLGLHVADQAMSALPQRQFLDAIGSLIRQTTVREKEQELETLLRGLQMVRED